MPTRAELLSLVDDTKHSPAIDSEFFPACKSDWYWTSTPWAASPVDCAWYVYFNDGGAGCDSHDFSGFVRAVRVGQSLVIGSSNEATGAEQERPAINLPGLRKRLIAAGPEMFATIEQIVEHLDSGKVADTVVTHDGTRKWLIAEVARDVLQAVRS
jgi:hypothetical protein